MFPSKHQKAFDELLLAELPTLCEIDADAAHAAADFHDSWANFSASVVSARKGQVGTIWILDLQLGLCNCYHRENLHLWTHCWQKKMQTWTNKETTANWAKQTTWSHTKLRAAVDIQELEKLRHAALHSFRQAKSSLPQVKLPTDMEQVGHILAAIFGIL